MNMLKLSGQFSFAEVHSWVCFCLPEVPERYLSLILFHFEHSILSQWLISSSCQSKPPSNKFDWEMHRQPPPLGVFIFFINIIIQNDKIMITTQQKKYYYCTFFCLKTSFYSSIAGEMQLKGMEKRGKKPI